jgi:hypothetical protein
MALNASGPISIGGSTTGQSINLELGRAAGATSNMGETALRTLAGKASGIISLADFYGKSNIVWMYSESAPEYFWYDDDYLQEFAIYWNGVEIYHELYRNPPGTSFSYGGYTYYRGDFVSVGYKIRRV